MGSVCSSSQPVRAWPASWNATTLRSAGVITLLFFSIPVFERERGGVKRWCVRVCVEMVWGQRSCTCNDPLNGVLKVFLSHTCSFLPGSVQSSLIDNVSNVRSWITCVSASKRIESVCEYDTLTTVSRRESSQS